MGTLDIGGTTWAIYGERTEADAYFKAASHGDVWSAAAGATRNQLLVTATRIFERTRWAGDPTEPIDRSTVPAPSGFQELQWPRTGVVDVNGVAVDSSAIPLEVEWGAYELALSLLNDATVQTQQPAGSNLKVDKLTNRVEGAVTQSTEKQYFRPTAGSVPKFPRTVHEWVGLWLEGGEPGDLFYYGAADEVSAFVNDDFGWTDEGIG